MGLTITVQQDSNAPQEFTMSDDVVASLDSYRRNQTVTQAVDGLVTSVPAYATLMEMIVGIFTQNLVKPAFLAFPPASLSTAAQQAATAQAALAAAQAAAIQGALG
jgi:hypothetical protein